jgi:ABC-type Fe3+ transport system substrate-binding protein
MKRFTTVAVALLLLMAGCSSSDPTASDEYVAPEELAALIDNWYAANDRADGSVLDLHVPEGYHLYGGPAHRVRRDSCPPF